MKIKEIVFFLLLVMLGTAPSHAQTIHSLTLEDCYQKAKENYPLVKQYDLIEKTTDYSLANASKGYLPQFRIGGQATYQSDVTQIPFSLPNMHIPEVSKDQYKVFGEASLPVTGLFLVKQQKDLINAKSEVQKQQLDVQLYPLKNRVTQLYFGILLLDAQLKQVEIAKKDVQLGISNDSTAIANGVGMASSADILQAELLNVEQKKIELESNRKQFAAMLSLFIHEKIDKNTQLKRPVPPTKNTAINRPELNLFMAQKSSLEVQKKLLTSGILPQFKLFIQGGYGRPGLNMLADKFQWYSIGGLSLSWNITNFYTHKKKRNLLEIKENSLETQKKTFLFNTKLSLTQGNTELDKQRKLLNTDGELVKLRQKIRLAGQNKLKNGTLSANDYLQYVHAENKAKQKLIYHQIQFLKTQYEKKLTQGN